MTRLSINVNKIALIRNARGTDFPNLTHFVEDLLKLGVQGITVHPRPDQRHIKYQDVYDLSDLIQRYPHVELNVEGYPDKDFLNLIKNVKPHQCTLVPDTPSQLTSDHGWHGNDFQFLQSVVKELRQFQTRLALFLEPNCNDVLWVKDLDIDAIEIYTEHYASQTGQKEKELAIQSILETSLAAKKYGLVVNAGHDLNLNNLGLLLEHCDIAEVSIGQAFTVECIYYGLNEVLKRYHEICLK
ncbi:pyridoxine 5'-phosphate synthase [Acinetobacter sp. CFCC 10889]|uniref:pyridoxine 5'-phosphate synthase n=1 Tax=Acinetobacter sp. CFCC 10889 TaxID=1775557 RepID=UPI000DCFDD59|nr:pyridoxine 5'-phosphate synthase [Acinetobacter sp. CFCC 10889]